MPKAQMERLDEWHEEADKAILDAIENRPFSFIHGLT
jgi:hypothetical protein